MQKIEFAYLWEAPNVTRVVTYDILDVFSGKYFSSKFRPICTQNHRFWPPKMRFLTPSRPKNPKKAFFRFVFSKMQKMLHETRLRTLVIASFTDMLPFPKSLLFKLLKGKEPCRAPRQDGCYFLNFFVSSALCCEGAFVTEGELWR